MSEQVKPAAEVISELMKRSRAAQQQINFYTQEQVDKLCAAMTWAIVREDNSEKIGKLAAEESRLGYYDAKYIKLQKKVRGAFRDMKDAKTVGIIERDPEKGIVKIAKPVGVISAVVPCTNPEATPVIKALCAIKCRNSIVFSPHPRTKKTNKLVCDILREVLKKYGAPEDLILTIEEPTVELSNEVMKQSDLIIATGGGGLVKAAYSSGTPAYGVGAGNVVVVVDDSADLAAAARKIMLSKTFDYATSCSADNSVVIQSNVYDKMLENLQKEGGYLCTAQEKKAIENTLFPEGKFNPKVTAQPASKIAELAGFSLPEGKTFIMCEETGYGKAHPLSGEKLSVVLTVYKRDTFEEMIDVVNNIHDYVGKGHTCGIHTAKEEHILELAEKTYTTRVIANQATAPANSGNWDNGMPFSLSLGCGTWGGTNVSGNVTYEQYLNTTWVSSPIPESIPDDKDLFGEVMYE